MKRRGHVETAVFQKAKKNQYYCGDSYFYTETENEYICALADGLGSGEFAKESSGIVVSVIRDNIDASVEQLIKKCNQELTGKRGAVVGILRINFRARQYTFASIGNIGILTIDEHGKKKRSIPNAGYLAGYHRPFKIMTDELGHERRFILFSDGVTDQDLSQRFLLNMDVQQVVQKYADYTEGVIRTDDTTLIAIGYQD
ncbi:phosphoserine phosphatase RsbX [Lentibacillus kapialis]|uniref:Phosphoserine phosphatase RsbX n=1 Tax=Lentibacillus kapialis TaxID=340214 RepID=A0A917PTD8_9BACI|nr:SpoIIE family protein phosphatase [Lentibacillus kapialis]GGJ90933.1 phosphoserine phosphatase RsbX [Lentibacillus kapialis]